MQRARHAAVTALVLALILSSAVAPGWAVAPASTNVPMAVPSWPTSSLVLSEMVTGAASASDEFVEIANQGPLAVDLAGLEVAYATASGATVTRKAAWVDSLVLEPGRRLLMANSLGTFASMADATYSGGLAATGGALVLRPVGGTPIDAVAWGDAVNGFVEGVPAVTPPPASSIERRPGGSAGNGGDTNDNAIDWFVQSAPSPQNLAASPVPAPGGTPSPSPSPSPTASPEPSSTPTSEPTPLPSPTVTPSPTPTADPTPSPTPTTTSTPEPSPSPTPSPSPSPIIVPIGDARQLPLGSTATIAGTLTTPLGALEDGRAGFLEDPSGGIALYLDATVAVPLAAGTTVRVAGTIDERFAQRTLRIGEGDVLVTGSASLPTPSSIATGSIGESAEGRRVTVAGTTIGSSTPLADGIGLFVDDGSGQIRVIVTPDAIGAVDVPAGSSVAVTGAVGQRDSSGTGAEGYRVLVTIPADLVILPSPTPSPTPEPSPTPSAGPTPTPAPSATPSPTTSPTTAPGVVSIADARRLAPGGRAVVEAVVTAEAGRLGLPDLLAIQDSSGGIVVRLADGMTGPPRGTRVRASGTTADPYGQTELRLATDGIVRLGTAALPAAVASTTLGEGTEGRLVTVQGVLTGTPRRSSSQDLTLELRSGSRTVRIMADVSSGLQQAAFRPGATYRLTGVGGQRASRRGVLDGYRAWLRDARDVVLIARPSPSPSPRPSDGPGSSTGPLLTIAKALLRGDEDVTVQGVVTAGTALLDSSGRRIVIQDATAAVEVLLPAEASDPSVGTRLRVSGEMGRAYGAPRLRAADVERVGRSTVPAALALHRSPGAAEEWRLVVVSGDVVEIKRLGSKWQAELAVDRTRVVVSGLSGAGIPPTTLVEGRRATVIGIARRPYPTASDRRYTVVPRARADVVLGPPSKANTPDPSAQTTASGRPSADPSAGAPIDVDLRAIRKHLGETVRVGGLIVEVRTDGVLLDDGTATGTVVLRDAAAEYLALLEPGDPINAIGRVERAGAGYVVVVRDPAGLTRVGDLGVDGSPGPSAAAQAGDLSGSPAGPQVRPVEATLGDPLGLGLPGLATLASLSLVTLASVAVTLLRRERLRRQFAARMAARIATVVGRPAGEPLSAERAH